MDTTHTLNAHVSALIAYFNIAIKILPSDLPDINRTCDYRTLSRLSERLFIMEGRTRHITKHTYPYETSVTLRRLIINVLIFLDDPGREAEIAGAEIEANMDDVHPFLGP